MDKSNIDGSMDKSNIDGSMDKSNIDGSIDGIQWQCSQISFIKLPIFKSRNKGKDV